MARRATRRRWNAPTTAPFSERTAHAAARRQQRGGPAQYGVSEVRIESTEGPVLVGASPSSSSSLLHASARALLRRRQGNQRARAEAGTDYCRGGRYKQRTQKPAPLATVGDSRRAVGRRRARRARRGLGTAGVAEGGRHTRVARDVKGERQRGARGGRGSHALVGGVCTPQELEEARRRWSRVGVWRQVLLWGRAGTRIVPARQGRRGCADSAHSLLDCLL